MTEDLKPCPFCNSPVEVFLALYGIHESLDYYAIAHPDNTGCIIDGIETSSYSDKEELIKDWNKRIQIEQSERERSSKEVVEVKDGDK